MSSPFEVELSQDGMSENFLKDNYSDNKWLRTELMLTFSIWSWFCMFLPMHFQFVLFGVAPKCFFHLQNRITFLEKNISLCVPVHKAWAGFFLTGEEAVII